MATCAKALFTECREAFSPQIRPHRLRCGLVEFPMDLVLIPSATDTDCLNQMKADPTNAESKMKEIFQRRSLLVLGAGLGGGAVSFEPYRYVPYVVLILRNNGHYGFRKKPFIDGDPNTWEGETDTLPCEVFWEIVCALHSMGMQARMSCLGTSAGVDSILSVIATMHFATVSMRIEYFIAIAGAFHPRLYTDAAPFFSKCSTCIIVHHHEKDSLCPWPRVHAVWLSLKDQYDLHVYINELKFDRHPLVTKHFHNVSMFLLTQPSFWEIFEEYSPDNFVLRCYARNLGNYHETLEEHREVGQDNMINSFSHLLMFSLCACKAAQYATSSAWNAQEWIAALAYGARIMHASAHDEDVQTLNRYLAIHTRFAVTQKSLVPFVLAESILGAVHHFKGVHLQPSIYKASQLQGISVCLKSNWCCGPLRLLQLSFPKEGNGGSAYADFLYDRRLSSEIIDNYHFRNQHEWPFRPETLLNASGGASEAFKYHHFCDDEWDDISSEKWDDRILFAGLSEGDIVSFLVTAADGHCAGEIFGVVHLAEKVTRRPDRVSDVFLWASSPLVKKVLDEASCGLDLRLSSLIAVKIGSHSRVVLSWSDAATAKPDGLDLLLGRTPVLQHRKRPGSTPLQDYMNDVLRSEEALPVKLRNKNIRRQELSDVFSASVVTMMGPPGTGKTLTATQLLLHISEKILDRQDSVSILHCSWTKIATKRMLEVFIEEVDIADIDAGKLHIVYVGNGQEISLTAHQKKYVTLLELKGPTQKAWSELWQKSARIHVFVTVGRSHMPAYRFSAIHSWSNRFYLCHMDEASQVLQAYGLHILRFLHHDGKLLLTGDNRQLPGFSRIQWQARTVMRGVTGVLPSYLLNQQFRQVTGLGTLTSGLFYEGKIEDSEEVLKKFVDTRQFAVVVWHNDSSPHNDAEPYPAEIEADLAAQLYRALAWKTTSEHVYKIMSFYKKQQKCIAAKLGSDKSESILIDAAQGSQVEGAILSAGRTWCSPESVGFLKDRRRVNVAFSRCEKKLIILLHKTVGLHKSYEKKAEPQLFWHSIREVARRLGCEFDVGEVTSSNVRRKAQRIKEFTEERIVLTSPQVFDAIGDLTAFFNKYQLRIVGPLGDNLVHSQDSDSDACEETAKEGPPENHEAEDSDSDACEDEGERRTILPFNSAPMSYQIDAYLLEDRFCNISMTRMNKLFLAATWAMGADRRRNLLKSTHNFRLCLDQCVWGLAVMINVSLKVFYSEPSELTVELEDVRAKVISYPNSGPLCTVGELIADAENVYYFLQRLIGENCRSSFFKLWPRKIFTSIPQKALRDMVVDLILPYSVTLPLISMTDKHRDRSECKKNKAKQFYLDPLVLNARTGKSTSLSKMQEAFAWVDYTRQSRRRGSIPDPVHEHTIKFTPYNPSKEARKEKINEKAGEHLCDIAFTLAQLFASHGKSEDFYQNFESSFEVRFQ